MAMNRREFVSGVGAFAAAGVVNRLFAEPAEDALDVWQRETDLVKAETFRDYLKDGDTRGLVSLEKLERAFEKVFREARETTVGDVPAVWSVYNMGYIVKTRESLFSIDLHHRRAREFAPLLDFALITHNHDDHYRMPFYKAMNGAGKTVVSNFLDNYGAADWRKGGNYWEQGGYIRGVRTFKLKDVEIRTSLVDHNKYLIDFTTAFEIRVGNWRMYHSGDCGNAAKLGTVWGKPDLWLFFPGFLLWFFSIFFKNIIINVINIENNLIGAVGVAVDIALRDGLRRKLVASSTTKGKPLWIAAYWLQINIVDGVARLHSRLDMNC